jgi:hypothetical protein
VVGVHLTAGYDAPKTARALYDQARLGLAVATALGNDCDADAPWRTARRSLVTALEKDPSLRARARHDFKVLERSISFRALVGTLDLADPAAVAGAIAATEWFVPEATCGGGLYDYIPTFTSYYFDGHCPQLDPETPRPAPAERRYQMKGTTLIFEDGTTMELSFEDGLAVITGGPHPFAEGPSRCR